MNNKIKFIKTMGYNVFSDDLQKIDCNKKHVLNTISPNSYGIAKKDEEFRKSLKNSDILVLDGVYFALGFFLKTGNKIVRNQGPFVTDFFLKKAHKENLSVFFLGASEETLTKIISNLSLKYPSLKVSGFSPPFKEKFNEYENDEMIKHINNFSPDILFVGMTCPKQEKWSFQMKNRIDAKLICNIGGVFDWIAGTQKEIHPLWWKLRLAWLKRTIDRPEILKRYPNIGVYFKDMLMSFLGLNKIKLK